jgi:D-cysteine desulfhydrase
MSIHPNEPPRVELAQLPTPVVPWGRLGAARDLPQLLAKRDDLTGLELSGNKVRKLEYLIADALAKGADTLVTHGGAQSNHCRATAAVGARLGLRVRLLLRSTGSTHEADGNLFLDHLFGAECSDHSPEEYSANLPKLVESALAEERTAGRIPYFFPVGASLPLGCWGYIRCVAELADQLGHDAPVDLYCATSSGGTQAGLMIGRALFGCHNWSIRGVPVSDSIEYFQHHLRQLERETVKQFQLDLSCDDTPLDLIDGYIGEGYAVPYPAAVETIRQAGSLEGVILDPSYTSKALTGMLSEAPHRSGDRISVFLHTGGAFGMFARRDLLSQHD